MARGSATDATKQYLGRDTPIQIGEIGRSDVEAIDRVADLSDVENEAFMNEPVTVMVLSSGNDEETDLVQVGVNGVTQFFRRDVAQVVKRKFVARLARCKRTDFRQTLDDRMGEAMNVLQRHHSLKYPFTVVSDSNPRGAAWLRSLLAEAQ